MPRAAEAYKKQIEKGLGANPREANKARVILRDLLGPIQMRPEPDGSLWTEFDARPAALLKKAVGTSVGSDGSGGRIQHFAGRFYSSGLTTGRNHSECPLFPIPDVQMGKVSRF